MPVLDTVAQLVRSSFRPKSEKPRHSPCSSPAGVSAAAPPNSKPVTLRWPCLGLLIFYLCGLIAVLEYSSHILPATENLRSIPQVEPNHFDPLLSVPLTSARATLPVAPPAAATKARRTDPESPSTTTAPSTAPTYATVDSTALETSSSQVAITSAPAATSAPATTSGPLTTQTSDIGDVIQSATSATFANRTGYAPRLPHPGSQQRRHAPESEYGRTEGRQLKIDAQMGGHNLTVVPDADGGAHLRLDTFSIIEYYEPSTPNDDLCEVMCDGPALVFSNPLCWARWTMLSRMEADIKSVFRDEDSQNTVNWGFLEVEHGVQKCSLYDMAHAIPESGPLAPEPGADPSHHDLAPGALPLVTVMTDQGGHPTATSTIVPERPGQLTTMTIAMGSSEKITATAELRFITTVFTLKDAQGVPTATITTTMPLVATTLTLTDSNGVPTATTTAYIAPPRDNGPLDDPTSIRYFHPVSTSEYIMASFFPVLLSVGLSVMVQTIRSDVKNLLPFNALTRDGGATAAESLCMTSGGVLVITKSFGLCTKFKEPLSLLVDLLVLLAAVIVSLSSEAVGIKLRGKCSSTSFVGCYMGLGLNETPARAEEEQQSVMLFMTAAVWYLLSRWNTGVGSGARSIASMASLLQHDETRRMIRGIRADGLGTYISDRAVADQLGTGSGQRYSLRFFCTPQGSTEYGLVARSARLDDARQRSTVKKVQPVKPEKWSRLQSKFLSDPRTIEKITHTAFLVILSGFFVLVLYYEITENDDSFERFMDNGGFGVRGLFTAIGVLISFFWEHYFTCTLIRTPSVATPLPELQL